MAAPVSTSPRRLDSAQLARQWALVSLLSGSRRGYTVRELARELDVSKTTIERDLATLERLFPLVDDGARPAPRHRIAAAAEPIPAARFGVTELLALHAGRAALSSSAAGFAAQALATAIAKVRGRLAADDSTAARSGPAVFWAPSRGQVELPSAVAETLVDAAARQRIVTLSYRPPGATTRDYTIEPHRLLPTSGSLYVLARKPGHARFFWLAAHRIRRIELTPASFQRAADATIDHLLADAFGSFPDGDEPVRAVELRFDPAVADRARERRPHPYERRDHAPDGRLRVRFPSRSRWELITYVLSFRGAAELIEPRAWRDELHHIAAAVQGRHTRAVRDKT